jgi:hypothetical protein
MDPVGWTAEWLEWNTTYYLVARVGVRRKAGLGHLVGSRQSWASEPGDSSIGRLS